MQHFGSTDRPSPARIIHGILDGHEVRSISVSIAAFIVSIIILIIFVMVARSLGPEAGVLFYIVIVVGVLVPLYVITVFFTFRIDLWSEKDAVYIGSRVWGKRSDPIAIKRTENPKFGGVRSVYDLLSNSFNYESVYIKTDKDKFSLEDARPSAGIDVFLNRLTFSPAQIKDLSEFLNIPIGKGVAEQGVRINVAGVQVIDTMKKVDADMQGDVQKAQPIKNQTLSIVALVLACASFIPIIGAFLGIPALILAIVNLYKGRSKPLNIIAIVLSIITIFFYIGMTLLFSSMFKK